MTDFRPAPENKRPGAATEKGPVIGTIIIIIVLVAGAIVVFYGQYQKSRLWQENLPATNPDSPLESTNPVPAKTETTQSPSTEINALEEDLRQGDLAGLEDDINSLSTQVE